MKRLLKLCNVIVIGVVAMSVGACSADEPNRGGETIDNLTPTDDPTGTISLSMNNKSHGETYLGGIYIGEDNNFCGNNYSGYTVYFSDLGPVSGLGNVTAIPTAGWSTKLQVIPGHGYVAVEYYTGNEQRIKSIYRIYVVDYITSIGGGIIGADIKYQTPFAGADVDINVDNTDLTLSSGQTSVMLKITNKSFVPFEISNTGDQFVVEPIYDRNAPFIISGLNVSCPGGTASIENLKGSVVLTTESGRETIINVTQTAAEPYINLHQTDPVIVEAQGLEEGSFSIDSNVATELEVSSSAEWIRVAKQDTDAWNIKNIWYVTSTNCSTEPRIGYINIKYGTMSKQIEVKQKGFDAVPQFQDTYEVESYHYTGYNPYEIYFNEGVNEGVLMNQTDFSCKKNVDWIYNMQINYSSWNRAPYIYLNIDENYSTMFREGSIEVYYYQQGYFDDILYKTITIRQSGSE